MSAGYADEHFPFVAQVIKKSVNIRAGANTNFEKIDTLNQGDEVVVLSKSFDWYKVQLPLTAKSFIRADYLKMLQNSTAQLIGDKVNIRATPNSNSASLGIVTKDSLVKVITQINGWWQVEPPTQAVGWIRQDFLAIKSIKVDTSVKSENKIPATMEVKGKLLALNVPKGDIRYRLIIDGKTIYYIQSDLDISRFNKAIVSIKGRVVASSKDSLDYPLFQIINISLLL